MVKYSGQQWFNRYCRRTAIENKILLEASRHSNAFILPFEENQMDNELLSGRLHKISVERGGDFMPQSTRFGALLESIRLVQMATEDLS